MINRYLATILFAITMVMPSLALEVRGVADVIDGDTINIDGLRIRMHGIDAPEIAQTCKNAHGKDYVCGESASRRLRQLAGGKEITCIGSEFDQYKRMLAVCSIDGANLNRQMVAEGHAWAFVRYSQDYVTDEETAKSKRLGVFAVTNITPWDFRATAWAAAGAPGATDANKKCPIKGNVSRKGDRIYHMPWQRDYRRVRIEGHPEKRWFCNENEADLAGWRKAAR